MIIVPQTPEQLNELYQFLRTHSYVQWSNGLRLVGWESNDKLQMVVGMDGKVGRVAQLHVAMAEGFKYTPKEMLRTVFEGVFSQVDQILGVVNSLNTKAMDYDLHLGFTEIARLPGMHDDGGDLVILGMKAYECRYLRKEELAA